MKPFPIRSDDERGYHSDKELDDNIQLWLKEWKSRGEQLKNSQPPKSVTILNTQMGVTIKLKIK